MNLISHQSFSPIIQNLIRNSIDENFEQGGRYGNGILGGGQTQWEKSYRANQQRGKTLMDTGLLSSSIQVNVKASGGLMVGIVDNMFKFDISGNFHVETGSNQKVSDGTPLAAIHNDGGKWEVPITKKMKSFFWYKYFKTKDGKYKAMALTQKSSFNITMPARPFLVVQEEDLELIWNAYTDWIGKNI